MRRYEREWVTASERLGFWLDYDRGYFTFANTYIESVWWILSQMFEQDMLYEGHKVLPYCPLCGTTHSSHEVAQAYQDVKDPSITVAFEALPGQSVSGQPLPESTWILAWTTTPWTLPSNMATCVHPEFTYRLVPSQARPGRHYLIAEGLEKPVDELIDNKPVDLREVEPIARYRGEDLEGLQYKPLFDFSGTDTAAEGKRGANWSVVVDPYVTLDSGTGIVHVAPAFGEDDHRIGLRYELAMYCALQADGRFKDHAAPYAGMWFKDADPEILGDLKRQGNLVRSEKYEHSYPHCWRHGTPLYYFATSSWFVRTTAMKDELIAGNKQIRWTPGHIQDGRFGRWLDGVVDWALSRKRYWGTPLPIWRCADCGALECMGSFAQLFERAGRELPADPYDRDQWNPHRPYVDEIDVPCLACPASMNRVTEVIDCWFDAGSMPFAQHHYPFDPVMKERIDAGANFPANFISEAVDQTRGWFYTLHVIATFVKKQPAYTSCIVLGHVLDEQGKKMSKSLGNVVAPGPIIDQFGADAFRWFFYRSNPTQPSRFGPKMVRDSLKAFLIPLLNSWSFFTIYAGIDGFYPTGKSIPFAQRAPLDRWVLSRLTDTVTGVTEALDGHRLSQTTDLLEDFVDGLTNWYIRRSRRRFWKSESDLDKAAAHWTLYEVLATLSHVLAPFAPFLAEQMHGDLVRAFDPDAPKSVHLAAWPVRSERDAAVLTSMEAARRAVTLGHAARQDSGVGVRQPLSTATVVSVDEDLVAILAEEEYAAVVRDELNVKALSFASDRGEYVTMALKPNFRTLGKRLGKRMPVLAKALAEQNTAALLAQLEAKGEVEVPMPDGEPVTLARDDIDLRIHQREGTTSAYDETVLVALDTSLTEALLQEGLAREVINRIQAKRKDLDLAYDARIAVAWDGADAVVQALSAHGELVAGEVLASRFEQEAGLATGEAAAVRDLPFRFEVRAQQS